MMLYEEYSVNEAAKRIGVSVQTTYKLIKSGKLKAENAGWGRTLPRYRIREDDLRQYLRKNYPLR